MTEASTAATTLETTARTAKTARKPGRVSKVTSDDWQATLRQSLGAGMTLLGEILIQAGKDLTGVKPPPTTKKRRSKAEAQH